MSQPISQSKLNQFSIIREKHDEIISQSESNMICNDLVNSPLSVQLESGEVKLTGRTDGIVRAPAHHLGPGLPAAVFTLPVLDEPGDELGEGREAGQLLSTPHLGGTKYLNILHQGRVHCISSIALVSV